MAELERMTWAELGAGTRALAQQVADDGYRPDIVLGIARGGLLVAGAVAYALGVKNTFTMNVEFYGAPGDADDPPARARPRRPRRRAGADRRRRGRHRADARARQGLPRGQGGGGS